VPAAIKAFKSAVESGMAVSEESDGAAAWGTNRTRAKPSVVLNSLADSAWANESAHARVSEITNSLIYSPGWTKPCINYMDIPADVKVFRSGKRSFGEAAPDLHPEPAYGKMPAKPRWDWFAGLLRG
jgi:hypothetical protein